MVVSGATGSCLSYPTWRRCTRIYLQAGTPPARASAREVRDRARELAEKAVSGYEGAGVLA